MKKYRLLMYPIAVPITWTTLWLSDRAGASHLAGYAILTVVMVILLAAVMVPTELSETDGRR